MLYADIYLIGCRSPVERAGYFACGSHCNEPSGDCLLHRTRRLCTSPGWQHQETTLYIYK
ncbi:hypothetical protein DM02DRAFT_619555 [Periconia macrospinosa]|uniref:Uncharacterized protein n=1 Tax=Periconia macrospinosa TaxID=97972 RepID=A0A2V1D4W9_9PLEO|nr:hypothetical protein DM02DRAFT_619555 [Periconia macrospinosa]